jgi:NAD+ kinase
VTFRLARLPGHSYYRTLNRKLGWSGQPNYRR